MIDYTHPARPARHAACGTWDTAGHACNATGDASHDCDAFTIVTLPLPNTGSRWVITGGADARTFPVGPMGRGAHRPAGVSLVKAYVSA